MPVCCSGEDLQTIPVHLEQLSGTVPLLDSGVFLQKEQGTWQLQIPTATMFVVFLLYLTIFFSLWLNLLMFTALFSFFCFKFSQTLQLV